jgi:predicted ABC-type ATPase
MKTFLNIRGTNGSGKSTLARRFFGEHDAIVELMSYQKEEGGKVYAATGRVNPDTNTLVVGKYPEDPKKVGGLDTLPSFEVSQKCIELALALPDVDVVVAEGVLASTVMGSWDEHAKKLREQGHRVIWAFMSTDYATCLKRIYGRQAEFKQIKEEQVRDKWLQIDKVRQRAELRSYIEAVTLPFEGEWDKLKEVLGWKATA